jgi:hypothetical protein
VYILSIDCIKSFCYINVEFELGSTSQYSDSFYANINYDIFLKRFTKIDFQDVIDQLNQIKSSHKELQYLFNIK